MNETEPDNTLLQIWQHSLGLSREADLAKIDATTKTEDNIPVILVTVAELERLRNIESCARYLINSNAWVGDTDGIEATLSALQELLGITSAKANS